MAKLIALRMLTTLRRRRRLSSLTKLRVRHRRQIGSPPMAAQPNYSNSNSRSAKCFFHWPQSSTRLSLCTSWVSCIFRDSASSWPSFSRLRDFSFSPSDSSSTTLSFSEPQFVFLFHTWLIKVEAERLLTHAANSILLILTRKPVKRFPNFRFRETTDWEVFARYGTVFPRDASQDNLRRYGKLCMYLIVVTTLLDFFTRVFRCSVYFQSIFIFRNAWFVFLFIVRFPVFTFRPSFLGLLNSFQRTSLHAHT
jgi:hypothetical protein